MVRKDGSNDKGFADLDAVGSGRRRLLFALMTTALLAICSLFVWVLAEARRDVGLATATSAANLAAAVAHDVDRNIDLLDLSIQAVTSSWSDPAVQALSPALRNQLLFDHSASAQDFGAIVVLDPSGRVRADSKAVIATSASFEDRDYFRVHESNSDVGLFVSKPFVSRVSGKWLVGLSRRINAADGSFAGVVVGTLELTYLNKLYKGLNLGSDGSITLFRTDGRIITREPYVESDIRRSLGGDDTFNLIRSSRSGSFEGPSPIDGRRRIISFHRVGNLPLIQDIEISVEAAYAGWWRKALAIGGMLGFLCLSSLSLLVLLNAELARRVRVEATLERLAATDPLTGLANRRRFGQALDSEWRRAIRDGSQLALLMIDADHFKAFNDLYGHQAGDELLKALAEAIAASIRRPGDIAARYGGEEFAVLLPGTDTAGALSVAEAIRQAVLRLAQTHAGSGERVATVSIGVSALQPRLGQSNEDLVAAADAALYRAKHAGRNTCNVAVPRDHALSLVA